MIEKDKEWLEEVDFISDCLENRRKWIEEVCKE